MSDSRRDLLTFAGLAAAVALLYFPDWLPLAALGGLIFVTLAWYRLDLALIFVLLSAPFYRFPRSVGPAQFTVSEMLIVACFLAWLGSLALRRLRAGEWGLDLPPGWRVSRSPALFFLAARARAAGADVKAATILTVSDVLGEGVTSEDSYLPLDELERRTATTLEVALVAATSPAVTAGL